MGRVYRARDERLHRDVAIKVMHTSKARDPDAQRRFLREGRGLAAVEHPHVMTVHQVGEHQGLPYIVMQRLVGRTLKQAMQTAGRLPLDEILRIARETADGLAARRRAAAEIDPSSAAARNTSMPHKVTVIPLLDGLGESARVIGAVNCVVRRGDRLIGENTDGKGFLSSLVPLRDPQGARVMLLGAGVRGNRVLGGSTARHRPLTVDAQTLQPLPEGTPGLVLTPAHVHRALRTHLGLTGTEADRLYPIAAEELDFIG
jgi:hypothetical protein